jgi:hypothetical protein
LAFYFRCLFQKKNKGKHFQTAIGRKKSDQIYPFYIVAAFINIDWKVCTLYQSELILAKDKTTTKPLITNNNVESINKYKTKASTVQSSLFFQVNKW